MRLTGFPVSLKSLQEESLSCFGSPSFPSKREGWRIGFTSNERAGSQPLLLRRLGAAHDWLLVVGRMLPFAKRLANDRLHN